VVELGKTRVPFRPSWSPQLSSRRHWSRGAMNSIGTGLSGELVSKVWPMKWVAYGEPEQ